ncbi:NH(3)-dependent NAD(+) synthetase [Geoalkalibacter ferrihydriticus]|uniref:Glutamine-dependent NAD(+) synthetase n=2 Tax=Geoalkalibacter ferrihydriticus TaxID=392333 RepID=A0A0C2EGZ7_9BACT|nr:NAD(+) synthase [Geoalkalibacter ferrihydriticus]KIH77938.1 NAD synthetase [Geoalkalibacter ferrihydriticus DSM 17813]SDM36339.1 NH(3)-dependent NAD(+) synthetase [Geoalkalibacter ferrihydriticus]
MNNSFATLGYLRLGVATPALRVADVAFNTGEILRVLDGLREEDVQLAVFPELCLTGYSCADLFYQDLLLKAAAEALPRIAAHAERLGIAVVVGLPVRQAGALFNCAAFLAQGRTLGLVPKTYLPNTNEFYEERWFASSREAFGDEVRLGAATLPFGTDLLFRWAKRPDCIVGIEICEDLWAVCPPSSTQALAGATVLVNPSASPEILGKQDYRRALVQSQSARCLAAYAYASAGPGESSTDLVYAGHSLIAENGQLLAESERFCFDSRWAVTDVDLLRLQQERLRNNAFSAQAPRNSWRMIDFECADAPLTALRRDVAARPFVPSGEQERSARCREIFALQTTALAKRLRHTGSKQVVIGISGGLDSTLALLVAVGTFDKLGLDRQGILALTLPGFGTTTRTRGNAEKLAELLGVSLKTISIDAAVLQHFEDIGHDGETHDITYENAQARERTQILMDVANAAGGLVVGTGDLSELALGWCTYNADHMSMYGVNAGVPKTLVRHLVEWCAQTEFTGAAAEVLHDICATPVSPELLPPDAEGAIRQKTEEHIGPYLLHDFFLFQAVRMQFAPARILFLAEQVFADQFSRAELLGWLKNFYRRFFSQQFKRSCLPDGPKIGSLALSPRGDWRMPSDACAALWVAELELLEKSSD